MPGLVPGIHVLMAPTTKGVDGWGEPYNAHISLVIAGLDPAIHLLLERLLRRTMDTRVKPAYDDGVLSY
jgi:hypothetical protein